MPSTKMNWLTGGGEAGELIRAKDWSSTPLGPIEEWPQSLRTAVSLCLSSTFPILIAWGPEDIQIYNDAYRPICGPKHPEAIGQNFKICWATALPVVGDAFDRAHEGEGTYIRDQRMFLDRYGYLEEAFMTFSFSPIGVESGEVGGVFHPISESTDKVLGARRTAVLRDVSAAIAKSLSIEELCQALTLRYESMELDLPFVLFYQLNGNTLQRKGVAGVSSDSRMAPQSVELDNFELNIELKNTEGWPFEKLMQSLAITEVNDLQTRFGSEPSGPYPEAPTSALMLPIMVVGSERPFGFLIAGVSARRALDAEYSDFYALLSNAVSTAVANVVAYQHEQRKAEELAEIDRAKTAFFSNVSHEFRTPLTLMVGPLEDALADSDEPLGDAQRQRLEVTHRNSLRLLKLVNALLDFSRIEAGRAKGNFAATNLAQLTEDLSGVFRSTIEKAGLRYDVTVADLGEAVYLDRDMWEKIVFNLLSNAFKFTFSGSIAVTLMRVEGFARLEISDTGSGIAEEELPRVFERFHRIENSKGRTYEGTGIGLAMIQELVKLHKGKIGVTSEPGKGSTFYVEIPFGTAHVPSAELAGANNQGDAVVTEPADTLGTSFIQEAQGWLPESQQATEGLPPQPVMHSGQSTLNSDAVPIRILLADDNSDMRGYLRRLMENYAVVETCGDGEAAYQAICRERPDVVVSDVMMPVLDGFGLIEKVRNNQAIKDVPIILLSARAGEEAKIEGLAAGADDYLVKPFSANELLSRVKYQVDAARRRKAAQSELALSEQYFRSLVDASTAIIWTCDATGYCTYLSRRWGEVTGRDTNLDLGYGWIDNVHPEDQQHTRDTFLSATNSLSPFNIIYRLRHANGDYRWAIDSGAPLFDKGIVTGFVGTVVDVHDERVAKDSMELLANDLTEINQRQNEFLVTLAHELRNPLAPIRSGLEIMRLSTSANQRVNNIHQMMDRQVNHLTHLVDDLLDIARITKGKINLKKERVALKTVLTNAVEISMPLIEAHHHELIVDIREQDLTIDADPHRITQVISNVLNNAAKYTPNGGKIVVTAFAEGDAAVLTVKDTGIGLSTEALSTVFELFSQIQTEVDRAQGGLGIGLHLVKRLVDLHDGSVAVSSLGKGKGSTFIIRLPRVVTAQVSQNVETSTSTESATALRILIVDDNRDGAETLATLMEYCGHTACTAGNGKDALALAAEALPHIVFLDIGLPDMSGYEVAVEMRKMASLKHTRFVALTGRGAETDKAQALAVGFDYHLTKPASLDRLNEILSSSA